MAKLATKAAAKPAAKSKLAAPAKGAAKPGKALAKASKPKTPAVNHKVGDVVEFTGYQNREDGFEELFEVGDRLVLVEKKKDGDNGDVFFSAVKEEDAETFQTNPDDVAGDQIYPPEFKKAEKLPEDPYKIEIITNDTLDTMLAEHEGDALETAKALQEDIARGQFYLGGALQNLYAERAWLEYGEGEGDENTYADDKNEDGTVVKMSGWDKFCREHFNESGRKCFDLLTTYRAMAPLLDAERLDEIATNKKIGYVKLAAMKNVVTADNVDALLEAAETQNVSEFKETLRTDYVGEGGAARTGGGAAGVKRITIKAVFFEDQSAGVEQVLAAAAKEFGFPADAYGNILERIIMDWGVQNLGEPVIKKARSEKRKVLKDLKGKGVDTKSRMEADAELEEFLSRNEEEETAE